MHEQGLADHELVEDHERERVAERDEFVDRSTETTGSRSSRRL
jgi:hypothetical protein